jgi:undecaprenyl-diphosphatase
VIICVITGVLLGFFVADFLCLIQDHTGDFWARPYDNHLEAFTAMELLYFPLPDSSFPSNAMCGLAAIAAGVGFADRRAAVVVWVLVILWGLGRICVGIHYPVDIVGGILIGCATALVGRKVVMYFNPILSWFLGKARRVYLA